MVNRWVVFKCTCSFKTSSPSCVDPSWMKPRDQTSYDVWPPRHKRKRINKEKVGVLQQFPKQRRQKKKKKKLHLRRLKLLLLYPCRGPETLTVHIRWVNGVVYLFCFGFEVKRTELADTHRQRRVETPLALRICFAECARFGVPTLSARASASISISVCVYQCVSVYACLCARACQRVTKATSEGLRLFKGALSRADSSRSSSRGHIPSRAVFVSAGHPPRGAR